MNNITLDLNKFKSSGVYTVEIDASESIVLNTKTIRLIVGFSKQGVFNAPVFLKDKKDALRMFGDIDKTLEKRGSFFHRSLFTALETGPVYALNLLKLDNTPNGDKVNYRSFSVDTNEDNGLLTSELLSSFYNKERFWKSDEDYFQAIVNNGANSGKLLSFTNLSQKPVSIFIKKAKTNGFDLTARDFYGLNNIPEYVNEFDYVSEYFIDVIIVKGDWTNYTSLSIDTEFSNYFDDRGLKLDQLDNFLANDNVELVASLQGSVIPDFTDRNGTNYAIDTIVNNASSLTGVFMVLNKSALDDYENSNSKLDMIGHNLVGSSRNYIDFLSYTSPISEELSYAPTTLDADVITYTAITNDFPILSGSVHKKITLNHKSYGGTSGYFYNNINIPKPLPSATSFTQDEYNYILNNLTVDSLLQTTSADIETKYVKVEEVLNLGNAISIKISHPDMASAGDFEEFDEAIITYDIAAGEISIIGSFPDMTHLYHPKYDTYYTIGAAAESGGSTVYDIDETIAGDTGVLYAINNASFEMEVKTSGLTLYPIFKSQYFEEGNSGGFSFIKANPHSKFALDHKNSILIDGDTIIDNTGNTVRYITLSNTLNLYGQNCTLLKQYKDEDLTVEANTSEFLTGIETYKKDGTNSTSTVIQSSYGNIEKNITIITPAANKMSFRISNDDRFGVEVGYYVQNENDKLTKVISKTKTMNIATGEPEYLIKVNEPVKITNSKITRYLPIQSFAERLQPTFLEGFKLKETHLPLNASRQQEIYGVIDDTNIGTTLNDNRVIKFRYVVDTMEGVIAPNMGAKSILTKLAKDKGKCLAFINAPSVKQFSEMTDPRFTDLPDPENGIPKPIFNTQYVADGGNLTLGPSFRFTFPTEELGSKFAGVFFPNLILRENNKSISVPPAADVSNNFILKFINGTPYKIVAGEKRGIISNPKLVGVEYPLLDSERDILEPFGLNLLLSDKLNGTMIYSNNLAYQKTLSAYNNLHVRDLLITIEENIETILSAYVWEFNDAKTRLEIKSLVDRYLETVKNAGGINDFLTVMNEKNNTSEIIGQKFGIIDIAIEPPMGLQKIINRLSILKNGTISSGGFVVA